MSNSIAGFAPSFFEKTHFYNRTLKEDSEPGIYFLSADGTTLCAAADGEKTTEIEDLIAISAFVNEKLAANREALNELSLDARQNLWKNLVYLDSLIGRHNKKIDESLCIMALTVLLLLLSLGFYDYSHHLLAERLKLHDIAPFD